MIALKSMLMCSPYVASTGSLLVQSLMSVFSASGLSGDSRDIPFSAGRLVISSSVVLALSGSAPSSCPKSRSEMELKKQLPSGVESM